jgi:monoterpene epsilon-lactone hydrolase
MEFLMASLRAHILNTAIRFVAKRRLAKLPFTPSLITASRARMEQFAQRARIPDGIERELRTLGGVAAEWTRPPGPTRGVILYCHGGAYAVGSAKVYRGLAARFATQTGCAVATIDYRLVPEHPYPAAADDAIRAYAALLEQAESESIVIAGDSAGGNLALVTLLRARDRGLALPAAAVLLSPWTDLTGSGQSMQSNRRRDPMLPAERLNEAARMYAPAMDLNHADVSPLFADLRGLPPLSIHVGSTEILLDDSQRLAERARRGGVEVSLSVWPKMPHVFPVFADFLPEGRRAIDQITAFISSNLSVPQAVVSA